MMRQEVSKKNKYYLEKYRRLELKNFCLQYPEWEKKYYELANVKFPNRYSGFIKTKTTSDPVATLAIRKAMLWDNIQLINNTAIETDEFFANYILLAVTKGYSWNYFFTNCRIPCGRDYFYELVRKFYFLLDKKK